MRFRAALTLFIAVGLAACSPSTVLGPGEREVKLPNGASIVADVLTRPEDMARGMMYRDSLAANRGMLFIHDRPSRYPYWMHNVKVPLDIIWMDKNRRVVEISANTPPCDGKPADQCPSYGGKQASIFVLELGGGMAARYNVTEGAVLDF